MKPITKEWVDKAEGDYKVASDEWHTPNPVCDAVCFHAQQCVEKYLKAWLTEHSADFPRTHDLSALAKLCLSSFPELSAFMDGFNFLTSSSVEIRYPGTSMDAREAEQSLRVAGEIRDIFRRKLS